MPLRLVLSENRPKAFHSRQGKGTHLKSAAIVALHTAIIGLGLPHLDGLTRLRISLIFSIAHASCGRVHLGFISDHSDHRPILINHRPWAMACASQKRTALMLVSYVSAVSLTHGH